MDDSTVYDLAIIGGGINGVGIAAQAALSGLKVYLCEQGDLACATSSYSTKLIHGGIRYLENYEFGNVYHALCEQKILLKRAPHLVHRKDFVLIHARDIRSQLLVNLGVYLYKFISGTIFQEQNLNLKNVMQPLAEPKEYVSYNDCQTNDARLVIENAMLAAQHGAVIKNYNKCTSAGICGNYWQLTTTQAEISAKALINATGPWVNNFLTKCCNYKPKLNLRYVAGSHIIVPSLYRGEHAYLFQHIDNRVVFTIPYQDKFSLIGTTDREITTPGSDIDITSAEKDYLLEVANQNFKSKITSNDIVHTYSGVRPLVATSSTSATANTRGYRLIWQDDCNLPLLNVYGGKLTTYRALAEKAVNKLKQYFPKLKDCNSSEIPIPGSVNYISRPDLYAKLAEDFTWLAPETIKRYVDTYGTSCLHILAQCQNLTSLGKHYGCGLYQTEIDYLIKNEFAKNAEDILWRRTNIGLLAKYYRYNIDI